MNKPSITYHIGLLGNSPGLTPIVCNRPLQAVAVISLLDYKPGRTNRINSKEIKICQLCEDLLLTGTTRGLKKANKVNSLLFKINWNIRSAQQTYNSIFDRSEQYCDAAHRYEQELIDLYLHNQ